MIKKTTVRCDIAHPSPKEKLDVVAAAQMLQVREICVTLHISLARLSRLLKDMNISNCLLRRVIGGTGSCVL